MLIMVTLAAVMSVTNVYASNVEVGAKPPVEITNPAPFPDVIEVIDEIYEAKLKEESMWESAGRWKITFYCACRTCSGKWGHQTSSGAICQEGVTAACAILPAGKRVIIDGFGERIIQDTGGGVDGRHIDIFYEDHDLCNDLGKQYREVWIRRDNE